MKDKNPPVFFFSVLQSFQAVYHDAGSYRKGLCKKDEKGVSVRALGGVPLSFQHPPVSLGRHASVFIAI